MDQFDAYFRRADLDGDGRISGAEAVSFFQASNLPKHVLAQIWMHADHAKTGFLGRNEFYNALRLVTVAQSKRDLTPDIVKAALYGPAAAKIPPPQIYLAATGPGISRGEQKYQIQNEENEEQPRLQSLPQDDKLVLQFMDSLHNYLSLFDALSSTLRQGWFDLASARHSMGASRINSRLLDLNFHSASTTLKITNCDGTQPSFTLRKWISSEHECAQLEDENKQPQDNNEVTVATLPKDKQVQKEQAKSLSVFGILISPKLRDTQLSFEKALETLVEIANVRSSLLYSFHQLHQGVEDTKE